MKSADALATVSPGKIALALGVLCSMGPFGTDMYLSALPQMATEFHATDTDLQRSVMTFFAGLTLGQLFYGPISDRTGRKPVIYFSMLLFFAASIGCLFARDVTAFNAWRFAQGLGGSVGMVLSNAVIRDLYTGREAHRLMSLVIMVIGVAPIVAPLIGGVLLTAGSWKAIFIALTILPAICAGLVAALLPETRMAELRRASQPQRALHRYARLIVDPKFIPYSGVLAFVQGGFFAYIAGSPFVLIGVFGLSPLAYSLIFGLNAIGLGFGAQGGARAAMRFGPRVVVKIATLVFALAALALALATFAGVSNLYIACGLLFVIVTAVGVIMPLCNVLGMEAFGAVSGSAAALMGAMGFGAGALASFGLGLVAGGGDRPMTALIAALGAAACLTAYATFGRDRDATAVAPAHG